MKYTIKDIDMKLMENISKNTALEMNLIALKESSGKIFFYTSKEESKKREYLSLLFRQKEINFVIGNKDEIEILIEDCYGGKSFSKDKFIEEELISLISLGIEKNTSDIHIEPLEEYANIRFRIDGTLVLVKRIKKNLYENLVNKIKLKADMDISDKLRCQDGKVSFKNYGYDCDLRISSIPSTFGEKLVVRILYKKNEFMNIDNLSLMEDQKNKINKLLKLKHGMVVINGPTGSGKSTTLYALLNSIDKEEINISTIEDPVEFTIEGITQTNVNDKVGLTFANGLKHILRQDPDVILIGEIRDEETAKIAIRASITGHKVYSTIHANSGNEVFNRLLDMGVEGYLVKEGVSSIITQRLVRKICEKCKVKIELKNELVEKLKGEELSLKAYYKGTGCEMCNWTGNNGRKAICEIIFPREYKSTEDITWGEELLKACFTLVKKGEISLEEYYLLKECEGLDVWV
ncbi:GspE/PulE family protein [Clostridium perfringens]|uniref:GspE/PulE family protein n=1 Tax=Clostridium perfringens TaxID=1502 RepID=UPI001A257EFA|nr:GspE/PulE family protein [Clostridium perfringens]HAT4105947.1 type II/IV secretion system protein [Clostridium perfringens]HAT4356613.1 type II/IV secretion system protein [Clostridium perfringens]